MTNTTQVDSVVLGGGIAGLSCADALLQEGKSCVVFDPLPPGNGSSSAPGMLINPATGRRAKMAWRAAECFDEISGLLSRVQESTEKVFFEQNGIVRPALTPRLSKNFARSPEKYDWPEDWVEWIPRDDFAEKYPQFEVHHGGLVVKNGMTVKGDFFIKSFARYLKGLGVSLQTGRYRLYRDKSEWMIETDAGQQFRTQRVIDATGHNQVTSDFWSFLPLHSVKGQTATFHFDDALPLESSVSSLGYMAYLNQLPDRVTVGSTYEHDFTDLGTDEEGLKYLKKKLDSTFPGFSGKSTGVNQWSGVRTTVPDKKPVIGGHPSIEGLYLIGALGSKGLLMGRYLAGLLINEIIHGKEADHIVSIRRFL